MRGWVFVLVVAGLAACLGPATESPDTVVPEFSETSETAIEADLSDVDIATPDPEPAAAPPVEEAPEEKTETLPPAVLAQQKACLRRGGRFAPASPGSPFRRCITVPKDANRQCTTGADCEGVCLARSRTCAPVVPLVGCHVVILDSGIPVEQCLN